MEDDAELVRRALARDQQAFAALYDRYADKLYDYARRQTGNAADAGDIVQDTFVLAIQRLHQLRDPSLVRPWLYAIARSEVHRRHRRVNRLQFTEPDEQAAMSSGAPDRRRPGAPAGTARAVHRGRQRAGPQRPRGARPAPAPQHDGRRDRCRARHSRTPGRVVVQRVRERLGRSIGVVLLATTPKCAELVELQRTEGTPLTVLSRKRLARHIDGCLTCSQQLSDRMRPETLLAALPIALAPAFLRNGVLQRMAEAANLAPRAAAAGDRRAARRATASTPATAQPATRSRSRAPAAIRRSAERPSSERARQPTGVMPARTCRSARAGGCGRPATASRARHRRVRRIALIAIAAAVACCCSSASWW